MVEKELSLDRANTVWKDRVKSRKEAISRGEVASFDAGKSGQKANGNGQQLNPDEVVEGMWEGVKYLRREKRF